VYQFHARLTYATMTRVANRPVRSCSGEVYSIQHCVIKFVSDLRQVGRFLLGLRFSPTMKTVTI